MSTDVFPSILEMNVFTALRTFILSLVACEVIRTQTNRVPMPKGDFIAMTQLRAVPLETNTHTYTATSETILRPTQFDIQIDSYGASAADRAQTIATLLRDDIACQSFLASGYDIQPLYAGDAHQMPLVTGEEQYLERWTFECSLQINPTITQTISSANTLAVSGMVDVDRAYPPS